MVEFTYALAAEKNGITDRTNRIDDETEFISNKFDHFSRHSPYYLLSRLSRNS